MSREARIGLLALISIGSLVWGYKFLKGKNLFKPLRYILTGVENGPNLTDIYPFIKNYIGEITK